MAVIVLTNRSINTSN